MGNACNADSAQAPPIKAGDPVPSVDMHFNFIPRGGKTVNMADATKKGKYIILGLPVPGYLKKIDELKAKGVEKMFVYCSNDGATMEAWAKDQKTEGTMITMLGDPDLNFTRACGMVMIGAPPFLGKFRCKRWVMVVEDGIVKAVEESYTADDTAGDANPEGPVTKKTRVEHVLTLL